MDVSTHLQVKTKEELLSLVLQHQDTLTEKETQLERAENLLAQHAAKISELEERIQKLVQELYGTRSEKFSEPQADNAFDEAIVSVEEETDITTADADITVAAHTRKKHGGGRKPLPAHLPREEIHYSLPEEQKRCACGCRLTKIGDERSEQLDIIPAQMKVLVHVREKWACKGCEDTILTAPLPKHPIPKSIASPGLLAHVVVCKYEDHLPLYRQERILQRIGVDIARSTLSQWLIKCGDLLAPLVTLMHAMIRNYDIAYADETEVQVLHEKDRAAQTPSRMWYFAGGAPTEHCVIYEYHETREGMIATTFFEDFEGYLHCDGYSGYEKLFRATYDENGIEIKAADVIHVGCFAHARRKFVDIIKTSKHSSDVAVLIINLIKKLYEIEKKCKEEALTAEQIYTRRQERAKPILLRIKACLDENIVKAPPQSAIAKAMNYSLNLWDALTTYITDGRLEIDNNASERGIKTFVIGRKNWLFFDQPEGAAAGAVIYSLIQTCKLHDVEPYAYFRHVFATIPYAQTNEQLLALLPFNYAKASPPAAVPL